MEIIFNQRTSYVAAKVIFFLLLFCNNSYSFGSQSDIQASRIVAIQLRAQGIPCTKPSNVIKDLVETSRDEMTWIITCQEATYRVKLIPHIGSKVDILDTYD